LTYHAIFDEIVVNDDSYEFVVKDDCGKLAVEGVDSYEFVVKDDCGKLAVEGVDSYNFVV